LFGIIRYFKDIIVINPVSDDVKEKEVKIAGYDDVKDFKRRVMNFSNVVQAVDGINYNRKGEDAFMEIVAFMKVLLQDVVEHFSGDIFVIYIRYKDRFYPIVKQKKQGVISVYGLSMRYRTFEVSKVGSGKIYKSIGRDGSFVYFFPFIYKKFVFAMLSVRVKDILRIEDIRRYRVYMDVSMSKFFKKYRDFLYVDKEEEHINKD
jgi:hypothetical protein